MKEYRGDLLFRKLRAWVGDMPDGAPFPSVRQLMREYGVSQFTVAPAVRKLRTLGLVESYVGRGSFVSRSNRAARPRALLLTNDWPSFAIRATADFLRIEAGRHNFDFRMEYYTYDDDVFRLLDDYRTDAVIIDALPNDFLRADQIQALTAASVPIVICRSAVRVKGIRYVTGNNAAAGILAANALYQAGHRKIGVLFSEPHIFSTEELVGSFTLCASSNHCEVTVFDCETRIGQDSVVAASAYLKANHGTMFRDVTALFVVSSASASGAYRTLRELGIPVPERVSILGLGAILPEDAATISTIAPCDGLIAKTVFDILRDHFDRKPVNAIQQELAPEYRRRGTIREMNPALDTQTITLEEK